MEYFEFYGLKPTLRIDAADLKRRFYQKSRELHPDLHASEDPESLNQTMDLAAFNNKAYHTLKDQSARILYILQQKKLLAEEGKNKLPQNFLMEMMDLNESLMEVKLDPSPGALEGIRDEIKRHKSNLEDSIAPLFDLDDLDTLVDEDWTSLRDHHLKLKYLERLEENLHKQ